MNDGAAGTLSRSPALHSTGVYGDDWAKGRATGERGVVYLGWNPSPFRSEQKTPEVPQPGCDFRRDRTSRGAGRDHRRTRACDSLSILIRLKGTMTAGRAEGCAITIVVVECVAYEPGWDLPRPGEPLLWLLLSYGVAQEAGAVVVMGEWFPCRYCYS